MRQTILQDRRRRNIEPVQAVVAGRTGNVRPRNISQNSRQQGWPVIDAYVDWRIWLIPVGSPAGDYVTVSDIEETDKIWRGLRNRSRIQFALKLQLRTVSCITAARQT